MCVHVCMRVACVCMCACVYMCVYVHVCVSVYVCVYMCMCVYLLTCVHMCMWSLHVRSYLDLCILFIAHPPLLMQVVERRDRPATQSHSNHPRN